MRIEAPVPDETDPPPPPPQRRYCLWPDNVPAWLAWQAVQTQWRWSAAGTRTGLDYAGVVAWLQLQPGRRPDKAALLADLQACERAMLDVLADDG